MTFYPKIAELIYETKELKLKLPIRASYIEIKKYMCPNKECESNYSIGGRDNGWTLTELRKYVARERVGELLKDLTWEHRKEFNSQERVVSYVPRELFIDVDRIHCPLCYIHDKKKNMMTVKMKSSIKLWCSTSPEYINTLDVLRSNTLCFWHDDNKLFRKQERMRPTFFAESLKVAKKCLNHINTVKRQKKGVKRKMKMYNVTIKQLKKEWLNYQKRKFIKRI